MPECLMLAYADNMPRILAERISDMAEACVFPHLDKRGVQAWVKSIQRRTRRAVREAAVFTWNGVAMTGQQIKARLGQALGSGFSG